MPDARLNGLNPLAYIGVNPYTPPDFVTHPRAPTTNDWQNFELGTFWLNNNPSSPTYKNVWVLVSLTGNQAIWALISTGGGDLTSLTADDGNTVLPNGAGTIDVFGGANSVPAINIVTTGTVANTLNINLKESISQPNTNSSGTAGVYSLGGNRFLHNYGTSNVFLGGSAGNLTLTPASAFGNTGIGDATLNSLTTSAWNTAVGSAALFALQSAGGGGGNNTAVGHAAMNTATTSVFCTAIGESAARLTTGSYNTTLGAEAYYQQATAPSGSYNICIGGYGPNASAGYNYTTTESSNIAIGNLGTASENNVIRIGTTGGGNGQQNKCWIAGIRGITTTVNDAIAVLIDSTGQLGTVSSSLRFKENVRDLASISSDILKLRPVIFNYISYSPESTTVGLIAEEVEKILPRLVIKNEQGQPETVKYHDLPVMILNELQKLVKRVEELERRLL